MALSTINNGDSMFTVRGIINTLIAWYNSLINFGYGNLQVGIVTLSSSQIIAKTKVDIVPDPGPGKFINIQNYSVTHKVGTVPFDSLDIRFNQAGNDLMQYGSAIDQSADSFSNMLGDIANTSWSAFTIAENQSLKVWNQATAGSGNGQVTIKCYYTIESA